MKAEAIEEAKRSAQAKLDAELMKKQDYMKIMNAQKALKQIEARKKALANIIKAEKKRIEID